MAGGELAGRTALVTGGPRGIGRAVCVRLAQAGARVALNYVSDEAAAAEARALVEAEGTECLLAKAETREAGEEKGVLQRVGAERAFEGLRPPRLRVISATRFGLSIADGDGRRGAAPALDVAGSLLAGRGGGAVGEDADDRPGTGGLADRRNTVRAACQGYASCRGPSKPAVSLSRPSTARAARTARRHEAIVGRCRRHRSSRSYPHGFEGLAGISSF